jgi:hypothetical protein
MGCREAGPARRSIPQWSRSDARVGKKRSGSWADAETFIGGIEPGIVEAVGAGKAPIILGALRGAVMGRKHELEGSGSVSRAFVTIPKNAPPRSAV